MERSDALERRGRAGCGRFGDVPFPGEGLYRDAHGGRYGGRSLWVQSPTKGATGNVVRFAGDCDITLTDDSYNYVVYMEPGTSVILDGPRFTADDNKCCQVAGRLEIRSGALNTPGSGCFYMGNSSSDYVIDRSYLLVTGGVLTGYRYKMSDAPLAAYCQTGGYVKFATFEVLHAADGYTPTQPIEVTGGILYRNCQWRVCGEAFQRGSSTNIFCYLDVRGFTTNIPNRTLYYGDCVAFEKVYYAYWYNAKGSGATGLIDYPHGITLGSVGDWSVTRAPNSYIYERLWFDTADLLNPTTSHTINYNSGANLANRGDFRVYGGGTLAFYPDACPQKMDAMTIGANTTLDCRRPNLTASQLRSRFYTTEHLTLGAGAKYYGNTVYNMIDVSETPTIGAGASIVFTHHDGVSLTAGRPYFLAAAGVRDAASVLPVSVEDAPDGWDLLRIANCTFLYDGTELAKDTTDASQWSGGEDGNLSTAANWSKGVAPNLLKGQSTVGFYTLRGDVTNDVDNLWIARFGNNGKKPNFPVRISGKPVKLAGSAKERSSSAAVYWQSDFPLIFNCDVTSTSASYFNVLAGNDSPGTCAYVAFLEKLNVPCTFDVSGHILIGGTATVKDVWLDGSGSARKSLVEVMNGGSLTVTNQTSVTSREGYAGRGYRIDEGGTMAFTGGTGLHGNLTTSHSVNGTLSIGIPLSAEATMEFYGKGRLNLASVKSSATAATVKIGEKLRVYPGSWTTVTEDGEGPLTLSLNTRATLGATNDWTYGVAAGVETATLPGARALTVSRCETLTIDTQNPDTDAAQTITFTDPIVIPDGFLEKTGAGTLVLATTNDLATASVTVGKGTLVVGRDQTFAHLALASGAKLLADAVANEVAEITVADDVSVAGVTLGATDAAKGVTTGWTSILTVPNGKTITGTPVAVKGQRAKVVTNDDGSMSLKCRTARGSVVVLF